MPELPDITVYIEALQKRILGQRLERARIVSPFLLRTVEPPVASAEGRKVLQLRRLGKRICIQVEGGTWLVLHLMIAGRLHWFDKSGGKSGGKAIRLGGRQNLAAFEYSNGTLVWTEAGSQKRASLHLASEEEGLRELDPGGVEVLECSLEEFARELRLENHTLKRSLTDPRWFSGIGNAYSDEILWAAKLSPTALTQKISDEQVARLYEATRATLTEWIGRLRIETGEGSRLSRIRSCRMPISSSRRRWSSPRTSNSSTVRRHTSVRRCSALSEAGTSSISAIKHSGWKSVMR